MVKDDIAAKTAALIEEADGVEMPDGTIQGQSDDKGEKESAETPDAETEDQTATQSESEETETQQEETPQRLDQHPRFREVIAQNREMKKQMKEMSEFTQQLKGQFEAMQRLQAQPHKQTSDSTPEQLVAKQQLLEILGLQDLPNIVNQLKQQTEGLTKAQTSAAFQQEESQLLEKIDKFKVLGPGETPDDVLDKLEEHISKHPVLSGMKDKPGVWTLAFNDLFISQASELGKRAAGSTIIKEQQKLKAANMESTAIGRKGKGFKTSGSVQKDLASIIKAAGGEDEIDFDA